MLVNGLKITTNVFWAVDSFQLKTYAFWPFIYMTMAFWWPEKANV